MIALDVVTGVHVPHFAAHTSHTQYVQTRVCISTASIQADMQRGQSAIKRRIEANKRDCAARANYAFSPPVVGSAESAHKAEIRAEMRKTKPASARTDAGFYSPLRKG